MRRQRDESPQPRAAAPRTEGALSPGAALLALNALVAAVPPHMVSTFQQVLSSASALPDTMRHALAAVTGSTVRPYAWRLGAARGTRAAQHELRSEGSQVVSWWLDRIRLTARAPRSRSRLSRPMRRRWLRCDA